MKKRKTIITALVAFLVLLLGVNFNAEAQLGGLLNKAKDKVGGGGNTKKLSAELDALIDKSKASIPQPGQTPNATFNWDGEAVATWDGAKNELTIKTDKGGNKPGTVLKVDASTGKVTDASGKAMGSLSATAVESPNCGTLNLKEEMENFTLMITSSASYQNEKKLEGYRVIEQSTGQQVCYYKFPIGTQPKGKPNVLPCAYEVSSSPVVSFKFATHNCVVSDKEVGAALSIYVASLMLTQEESNKALVIKKLGYDPDQKYTTDQLDDMVKWIDRATINMIVEYESSRPYAGFKDTHPELKNCKIGGVGLMNDGWGTTNYDDHWMSYWVVYELTDGRNIVTFSEVTRKLTYGDIYRRDSKGGFFEVTDWQRK